MNLKTEPIQCSLCDDVTNMADAWERDWDWFTGYLAERFVACKKCQIAKGEVVALRRLQSQTEVDRPRSRHARKSRIVMP